MLLTEHKQKVVISSVIQLFPFLHVCPPKLVKQSPRDLKSYQFRNNLEVLKKTFLIFVSFFITCSFNLLNLILGIQ